MIELRVRTKEHFKSQYKTFVQEENTEIKLEQLSGLMEFADRSVEAGVETSLSYSMDIDGFKGRFTRLNGAWVPLNDSAMVRKMFVMAVVEINKNIAESREAVKVSERTVDNSNNVVHIIEVPNAERKNVRLNLTDFAEARANVIKIDKATELAMYRMMIRQKALENRQRESLDALTKACKDIAIKSKELEKQAAKVNAKQKELGVDVSKKVESPFAYA